MTYNNKDNNMVYVYELRDNTGVIYVGVTVNLEGRLYHHKKKNGKFTGRTDITIHEMSAWPTRKLARKEEGRLKLFHGFEWTEIQTAKRNCKAQRVLTIKDANDIRSKYIPNIYSMSTLSKEYNVSKSTVQRILENLTYANE